jgi:hypothetical protein
MLPVILSEAYFAERRTFAFLVLFWKLRTET